MKIKLLDDLFSKSAPMERRDYEAGDPVFSQGDRALNIFAVVEGQVKLERYTIEGRSVLLHAADAGESFAEASLFSDVYHCNAIAAMPSRINIYPKDHVLGILRAGPENAEMFMALLASQVRVLRTRLELRNILSAKERIFRYLLLAASPENPEVLISVPLKQLATELGLAHETFYRELASLEKDGIIERNDKTIKILRASII